MSLPSGFIMLWNGSIVNIPFGWTLCDGTAGTPDLTDRFVIGAGDSYDPDDTGGSETHTHDFTADDHNHELVGLPAIAGGAYIGELISETAVTGTTDAGSSMPKYYALCYIMKT